MKAKLQKIMGVKESDVSLVLTFLLYSFTIGLATAFFYTPATSLFLQHYSRHQLPLGYIVGGILVLLVGRVVRVFQGRITTGTMLLRLVVFLVTSTLALIAGYFLFPQWSSIFVFIFFAWIRIYLFILNVGFWGLANRIFSVRQGKRMFSFIGIGEVVSFIISFVSIPFLLKIDQLQTEHLLLISPIGLFGVLLFISRITSTYLPKSTPQNKTKEEAKIAKEENISKPTPSYFRLVYAMAIFPILAIVIVEFLFFAQSQVEFSNDGEMLSSFLAVFFAIAAIVEFSVKFLISGKLMDRFGLKLGLIILPATLAILFLGVSLAGVFSWFAIVFFPVVVLGRLFVRALRTSFYDPSFQLLFLPIPEKNRLSFQNTIESGIKSYGNIFTGLLLLALMSIETLTTVHITYLFAVIAVIWVWVTLRMNKSYGTTLNKILFSASKINISNKQTNKKESHSAPEKILAYYYSNKTNYPLFEKQLVHQIQTESSSIKPHYYLWLEMYLTPRVFKATEKYLPATIRQKLHDQLSHDYVHWEREAKSTDIIRTIRATHMLGISRRYVAYKILLQLLRSENPHILRAAYQATGHLRRYELWPLLFEGLKYTQTALYALDAIQRQQTGIWERLVDFLQKNHVSENVLRLLLPKLHQTPEDTLVRYLLQLSTLNDERLHKPALKLLSELNRNISKQERNQMFLALENITADIVRCTHIFQDLQGKSYQYVRELLWNNITHNRNNIFNLLSVIYDGNVIGMIRKNFEKTDDTARSFAVEMLDMTVDEDVKLLVLPVIENDDPFEIALRYKATYPKVTLSEFCRLQQLANMEYFSISKQLRMEAIRCIGERFPKEGELVLKANASHPNQIIQRLAEGYLYNNKSTRKQKELQQALDLYQQDAFRFFSYNDFISILEEAKLMHELSHTSCFELFVVVISGTWQRGKYHFKQGESAFFSAQKPIVIDPQKALLLCIPTNQLFLYLQANKDAESFWLANRKLIIEEEI